MNESKRSKQFHGLSRRFAEEIEAKFGPKIFEELKLDQLVDFPSWSIDEVPAKYIERTSSHPVIGCIFGLGKQYYRNFCEYQKIIRQKDSEFGFYLQWIEWLENSLDENQALIDSALKNSNETPDQKSDEAVTASTLDEINLIREAIDQKDAEIERLRQEVKKSDYFLKLLEEIHNHACPNHRPKDFDPVHQLDIIHRLSIQEINKLNGANEDAGQDLLNYLDELIREGKSKPTTLNIGSQRIDFVHISDGSDINELLSRFGFISGR